LSVTHLALQHVDAFINDSVNIALFQIYLENITAYHVLI